MVDSARLSGISAYVLEGAGEVNFTRISTEVLVQGGPNDGDSSDLLISRISTEVLVQGPPNEIIGDSSDLLISRISTEVLSKAIPPRTLVQLDLAKRPTAERSTSPNFVLFQPLTENKFFNYVCPDSDVGPHTIIGIRPDCTSFVVNPTLVAGSNKIILDHFTQLYVYPGTITSSEIQDALIRGMVDRNGQCVAQAPDPVGTFEDPANANYYHNILDDGLEDSSAVSILLNEA